MVVFIAIELEDSLKNEIYDYTCKYIKPACKKGRWVWKHNYHITLKYIGEIREDDLMPLFDAVNKVSANAKPFSLKTGGTGVFGKRGNGGARVLWLGVEGELDRLKALKEDVEDKVCTPGGRRDNRFSPHITLARDVFVNRDLSYVQDMSANIPVKSISLMESRLEKGRRMYLPLSVHRLAK